MADDTATRTDVNNLRDEIKEEMATKADLNNLRDEIKAEMNARFDKMHTELEALVKMVKSQQTKTEHGGELVPAPAEGVVDENQTILVDNVALFKRFKGRVLIVRTVVLVHCKPWKYE